MEGVVVVDTLWIVSVYSIEARIGERGRQKSHLPEVDTLVMIYICLIHLWTLSSTFQ